MISERLKRVILKELKLKDFDFGDGTFAYQVPGWDSLSHIRILSAVENEYKINFKFLEIARLKKIEDLQLLIESKIK